MSRASIHNQYNLFSFLVVTVYINLNLPELIYSQYTSPSAQEEQRLCKHVDKSLAGHDHCVCLKRCNTCINLNRMWYNTCSVHSFEVHHAPNMPQRMSFSKVVLAMLAYSC